MDVKKVECLNIAMLPWAAFGHMTLYLHLANQLAEKGHSVSFIATAKNIKRLPKDLANKISFIEFKLPQVSPISGAGAEATSDLPYADFPYLKLAYDGLQPQLSAFLESSAPHWLILDFAPYWAVTVASKLGVRTAFFSINIASAMAFIGPFSTIDGCGHEEERVRDTRCGIEDWTVTPEWVPFESDMVLRHFEVVKLADSLGENVSGVTDVQRFSTLMRGCDVIAVRSSCEFEPEWLRLLEDICRKPVLPVGYLPPAITDNPANVESWRPVREWLDKWPKGSVVYVAFGSESTLSQEELTELALGLELSELPFFWVLKAQAHQLPEGFQEGTCKRGLIWASWAPQLRILNHDSVGGFLSHSGWSSVIEGTMLRKPLVLLPLFADQGLVNKLLTAKGLGYTIPRDERDGAFTSNSVAHSLRVVVTEEQGKVYREKAKEMSAVFGDLARQQRYVHDFANYLQTHSP